MEEVFAYFDIQDCVFPFKYALTDGTVKGYTSCTIDDDKFGFEWCSIPLGLAQQRCAGAVPVVLGFSCFS